MRINLVIPSVIFSLLLFSPFAFAFTSNLYVGGDEDNSGSCNFISPSEGLSGASVTIKETGQTGTTDSTGKFIADVSAEGVKTVTAMKSGYNTWSGGVYFQNGGNSYICLLKSPSFVYNSASELPSCQIFGINQYSHSGCQKNDIDVYKCALTGFTYSVKCDYLSTITSLTLSLGIFPSKEVTVGTTVTFSVIVEIARTPYKLYMIQDGAETFVMQSSTPIPQQTVTWNIEGSHTYKFKMVDADGRIGETEQVTINWYDPTCKGDIIYGWDGTKFGTYCCVNGKVSIPPLYDNQIGSNGQSCNDITPPEICGDGIDNDKNGLIDENPPCTLPPTGFSKLLPLLLIGAGLFMFGRRR